MSATPQDTPPPLDLLPCPFCGNEKLSRFDHTTFTPDGPVSKKGVKCYECNASAFEECWNNRVRGVDQGNGVREALETAIGHIETWQHGSCGFGLKGEMAHSPGCEAASRVLENLRASYPPAALILTSEAKQSKASTPNPKAKDGEA